MVAKTFEIVAKQRDFFIGVADIEDFELRESGQVPAEEILQNPHMTLYSLDFDTETAVFVETPPDVNLSQAAFYYVTQYEQATRVLTTSFATMIQLAHSVTIDDQRLVFIHSVGRAGSTLASQIFAQIAGVINIAEPDALSILVAACNVRPEYEGLKQLVDATIRILCKHNAPSAWVIKGRSYVIELGTWLGELYPQSKIVFLYREAEGYVASCLRAYTGDEELTDETRRETELVWRKSMKPTTPLIAQYDPDKHLTLAGVLSLMWLSVMERYEQLSKAGMSMLAIRYVNWRTHPRETAVAMLDYCGCLPEDKTAVFATLDRDSQAGTFLAQNKVEKNAYVVSAAELEELHQHLQAHPFIHDPHFEASNTLR